MVKRMSGVKARTASPTYSTDRSMAVVLRPSWPSVLRMTSLPVKPKGIWPRYSTAMASGTWIHDSPRTMATVMSAPPRPMAKAPMPPWLEVWLSAPSTTSPGCTRSR